MIKNKDSTRSLDTKPFSFNHFKLKHFALFYNGKQILSEGFPLDMSQERPSVWTIIPCLSDQAYVTRTKGLNVTYLMFTAGYCMLQFDLTPTAPPPKVTFRSPTRAI